MARPRGNSPGGRLRRLGEEGNSLPCQECRQWPPDALVFLRKAGDPLPYPPMCPACGRRIELKTYVGVDPARI